MDFNFYHALRTFSVGSGGGEVVGIPCCAIPNDLRENGVLQRAGGRLQRKPRA